MVCLQLYRSVSVSTQDEHKMLTRTQTWCVSSYTDQGRGEVTISEAPLASKLSSVAASRDIWNYTSLNVTVTM